jgi:hypothetical protein
VDALKDTDMRRTLEVLNELQHEGLYSSWALAGAMGLNRYIDPVATHDLDVTVQLPDAGLLVSLSPIYAALARRGFNDVRGEHIIIAGVAVQFLVAPPGGIAAEALSRAQSATMFDVPIRVFPLEHLLAIMLELGRPKDRVRLGMVLSQYPERVPQTNFDDIVRRFKLSDRLTRFKELAGV